MFEHHRPVTAVRPRQQWNIVALETTGPEALSVAALARWAADHAAGARVHLHLITDRLHGLAVPGFTWHGAALTRYWPRGRAFAPHHATSVAEVERALKAVAPSNRLSMVVAGDDSAAAAALLRLVFGDRLSLLSVDTITGRR